MAMRKFLKILHTLSACGLTGGLVCYMLLLLVAPQETPAAYADLRQSISALSTYVLLPSLAIALMSGLLSMAVHHPFLNKGWVWVKAAMGILMFKGVLTIVGAKADYAAIVSRQIADGTAPSDALDAALVQEWYMLGIILAFTIANVVLGVWRPKFARRAQAVHRRAFDAQTGSRAA